MSRFQNLTVTDVQKTIRDAVVVTLQPEDGSDVSFIPGQYLTFRRDFDGTELRRSYSICAGRNDGILQVGIKKVEGGAFSTWANQDLKPGMVLEAMEPMGSFHTPIKADAARTYIGFAAGSGITPVLSILKTILEEEPDSRFTLIYANRGVNTIMFREEIEALKNNYMGRLSVIHILKSGAQDIDLFQGRVDAEKCKALFRHWVPVESVDTAFICGPEPMMLTIAQSLRDHGMRDDQIKFELFASAQPGRLAQSKSKAGHTNKEGPKTTVQIRLDGDNRRFEMGNDMSILDAALQNAMDAPYACKAGVCSTCKCKVLEGEVEMAANHALEDYEVQRGYVLSCQSFPTTRTVTVDFDQ